MVADWALPMTPLSLAFNTLAFLAVAFLYGQAIRVILRRVFHRSKEGTTLDLAELLNWNLFYFTIAIPLLGLVLTFGFHTFTPLAFYLITGAAFAIVVADPVTRASARKLFRLTDLKGKIAESGSGTYLPILLWMAVLGSFLIRFFPLVGNYVYPADDTRIYAYLTTLVVDNRGYPFHLGVLESQTGPLMVYNYMQGFPALAAFQTFFTSWGVPQATAVVSQTYSALLPLAFYSILRRLFDLKTAVAGAVLGALVIPVPMGFFGWGGNGEYIGYFLAANLAFLVFRLFRDGGRRNFVLVSVGFAACILYHPYSFLYVLAAVPYPLYRALVRLHTLRPLGTLAGSIGSSALILSPVGYLVVLQELVDGPDVWGLSSYSINQENWSPIIFWNLLSAEGVAAFLTYLGWILVGIVALVGLLFLILSRWKPKTSGKSALFIAAWGIVLFVIHVNGPNGLLFVPYPFWGFVHPLRVLFFLMAVPVALLIVWAIRQVAGEFWRPTLPDMTQIPTYRKRAIVVGFLVVVVAASSLQLTSNVQILSTAGQEYTPLVAADIEAFQWIDQNLQPDAVIWVSNADGGEWILIHTGREVFPFRMLLTESETSADWNELDQMMSKDPTHSRTIQLLEKHGITHVYLGAKETPLWLNRTLPPISAFLTSQELYRVVYEKSGVYLLELIRDPIQ